MRRMRSWKRWETVARGRRARVGKDDRSVMRSCQELVVYRHERQNTDLIGQRPNPSRVNYHVVDLYIK